MFNTAVAKERNVNIVYLSGELNADSAEQFSKLLDGFIKNDSHQIVLELGDLKYVSSNGLKPLIDWAKKTNKVVTNRRLVICKMGDFVGTVFSITGLDTKYALAFFPTFVIPK